MELTVVSFTAELPMPRVSTDSRFLRVHSRKEYAIHFILVTKSLRPEFSASFHFPDYFLPSNLLQSHEDKMYFPR